MFGRYRSRSKLSVVLGSKAPVFYIPGPTSAISIVISLRYVYTALKHCHLRFHVNAALSGCSNCNSNTCPVSFSTMFITLVLALSGVSDPSVTGSTCQSRKIPAMAATNSTCENFLPGQFRTPSDQAMKDPFCGTIRVSCVKVVCVSLLFELSDWIQREGRHFRQSGPQYRGCVWTATWLGMSIVFAGIVMSISPMLSVRGNLPVYLAIGTGV